MKEYIEAYKTSKGELYLAMSTELFLGICLIFWALPLIALGYWIWHLFSDNSMLITKIDYYKQKMNYHKKQAQLKN